MHLHYFPYCYLLPVTGRDFRLLCLRSGFVLPSLWLRSWDYRMNGPITDLQRTCNGPALEGVGSSRRISLKPTLILRNGFGMVFTFFWRIMYIMWLLLKTTELLLPELFSRFSSILNKVNQPEINAYCYVVETVSRLYSILYFVHNSLIIFSLQ